MPPLVGFTIQERHLGLGVEALQASLATIEASGIDFASVLDHLTFWDGAGFDGLTNAAAVAAAHPRLPVLVSVLILPVRHPVVVARQISSLAHLAPGRLILGAGVGGEDRHEIRAAGVDPSTRGRRMDESLAVLRALLDGEEVTFAGEHFDLDSVLIRPAAVPRVPIVIGGRSDAALRRTAQLGDGWLAFACSPDRFASATDLIQTQSAQFGRGDTRFEHGLVVWCGFSRDDRPSSLAHEMEALYKLPYERFAKYCFEGSPVEVAKRLAPYAEAGCQRFSIIPVGESLEHEIDCVSETASQLRELVDPLR
jgi:alkanesulfonate monooxygenase SsuD/methylene tetrahydromethanopterin reductase-like flavin-dependent oxidoreductase (luciferase family)